MDWEPDQKMPFEKRNTQEFLQASENLLTPNSNFVQPSEGFELRKHVTQSNYKPSTFFTRVLTSHEKQLDSIHKNDPEE